MTGADHDDVEMCFERCGRRARHSVKVAEQRAVVHPSSGPTPHQKTEHLMPIAIAPNHPSLLIRRHAFERVGLSRSAIDDRLGLTDQEFRVEGDLIVVGPIVDSSALPELIADLEAAGLAYFEDFFDLSGNWPEWITLYARESGRITGG
jgi:hypothetical protein